MSKQLPDTLNQLEWMAGGNEEPERINWNLLGAKTMTQH
jgi:hypothetical protein